MPPVWVSGLVVLALDAWSSGSSDHTNRFSPIAQLIYEQVLVNAYTFEVRTNSTTLQPLACMRVIKPD